MTKEDYIKKIEREKGRATKSIISAIKKCIKNRHIIEVYYSTKHQAKYFKEESLSELEKEYPFLLFEIFHNSLTGTVTIKWRLK